MTGARAFSSPVLIGRRRELDLLVAAVTAPPHLVIVEGEAGVGKSRLVQELLGDSAMEGRQRLVGYCHPVREPFLLGPFVEALAMADLTGRKERLGPLTGALRPLLPEVAAELPPPPPPLPDRRAERHRTFRALRELLEALGPAVCVLEDLHWADEGTLELLQFLLPHPPRDLALVLTQRREDLAPSSAVLAMAPRAGGARSTISLAPLARQDVGVLIGALVGTPTVADELAGYVHERTAGIPFAVEEVVRSVEQQCRPVGRPHRWPASELRDLAVPPAVRDPILQRAGFLSSEGRCLVDAAAVVGEPAGEALLSEVAGMSAERGGRALCDAVRSSLLYELGDDCFGFRHALATQSVYDALPCPERRRLHLRVARALEAVTAPPPARLAHHFKHGSRPRRWAAYAEEAADAATSLGDDRGASRFLQDALSAPELPRSARARMAAKLGAAALFADSPNAAIPTLERLLEEEALPAGVRGELRFSLARLLYHAGDASTWYELMVCAVGELRRRPSLAARAMSNLARPRLMGDGVDENLAWLDRALEAAARQDDPAVHAAVLATRATVLVGIGDPAGWCAVDELPGPVALVDQRLELVRGFHHLGVAATLVGHHRRAERLLDQGEQALHELGHVRWGRWLETARAGLDHAVGNWSGLEGRAAELLDATTEVPLLALDNKLVFASLLLRRGELAEAERHLLAAMDGARAARAVPAMVAASGMLARAQLARGRADLAWASAAPAVEALRSTGVWAWAAPVAPPAIEALLACGREDEAKELVQALAVGLEDSDAPAAFAALTLCRAASAEWCGVAGAIDLWGAAQQAWQDLPAPYEAARAGCRRGQALLAQGDNAGSKVLLETLAVFVDLGATDDAAMVKCALRAHGVALPYPWRGGRRSYGSRLSPREVQVARLAGRGRSNREIARDLYLSHRTVEGHVASARRKLGVSSRADLVAVMDDGGSHDG